MLHGYLPYEIAVAISAVGFAARMAFRKLPEIIAAIKCPGEKQPELMRAMHGLPDRLDPSGAAETEPGQLAQITDAARAGQGDGVDAGNPAA